MANQGVSFDKYAIRSVIEKNYDKLLSLLVAKYLPEHVGFTPDIPFEYELKQDALTLAYAYVSNAKFGTAGIVSNDTTALCEQVLERYEKTGDISLLSALLQTIASVFLFKADDLQQSDIYEEKSDEEFLWEAGMYAYTKVNTLKGLALRRMGILLSNTRRDPRLVVVDDQDIPQEIAPVDLTTHGESDLEDFDDLAKILNELTASIFKSGVAPFGQDDAYDFAIRISEAYAKVDETGEWYRILHNAQASNDFDLLAERIFTEADSMLKFAQGNKTELLQASCLNILALMINPSLAES